MTDKKEKLDPIVLASMHASLLRHFDDGLEKRLVAASARTKNFFEGVRNFFSIVAFRYLTTPIAIVETVYFYYFPESKKLGMRTEVRELRVFGVRLARWPVTHTLVKYEVGHNPLSKDNLAEGVKKAVESPDEPDVLGSGWQEEKKP